MTEQFNYLGLSIPLKYSSEYVLSHELLKGMHVENCKYQPK